MMQVIILVILDLNLDPGQFLSSRFELTETEPVLNALSQFQFPSSDNDNQRILVSSQTKRTIKNRVLTPLLL
jgi:hypothetical protein